MQTEKFNKNDISIIREALRDLPIIEWHILYLRFWENFSILEIAESLEMKWEEVDQTIEKLLAELKEHCLNDPTFSRSEIMMYQQPQHQQKEVYCEVT